MGYGIEIRTAGGQVIVNETTRITRFLAVVDSSSPGTYSDARLVGYTVIAFPVPWGLDLHFGIQIDINNVLGTVSWKWDDSGTATAPGSKLVIGVL